MKMQKLTSFLLLFMAAFSSYGQIGGERVFEFLNVPNNARLSALGGTNITSGWDDLTQLSSNPALINQNWEKQAAISYLGYFADINSTSVSYAENIKQTGTWAFNLTYFNYGKVDSYDDQGAYLGEVSAKDYALSVGYAMQFGAFSAGATAKVVVSDLAAYQASGLLFDLGGGFKHPEKDMTFGLAIKNIGFLFSEFDENRNSRLPLDVQLGFTYKPEFMPLRFSLTTKNTVRDDLVYFEASNDPFGGSNEPGIGEEIFRRLVIGTEFLISPNFQLRLGYNHLLRQELKLENATGGAGLSFGFMFKVKRFEFAYSRALYHVAGGSNTFQLVVNTSELLKKNTND